MQVSFRYTKRELAQYRRINRLTWIPKWKSLGLALICLLPSVVLIVFTSSFIAVMGFVVVAIYLIAAVGIALIRQPGPSDDHDHLVSLTPDVYHELSSHSEYELSWRYFDELIEDDDTIQFRRLDRYIVLPKRIFTADEVDRVRELAAAMSDPSSPDTDRPVPLFEKRLMDDPAETVFRFRYQPDDLAQAALDPLAKLDPATLAPSQAKPAGTRLVAVWIGMFVLVSVFLLRPEGSASLRWTPTQFFLLFGALLLPFGLLIIANRLLRIWSAKRLPQVPLDENRMALQPDGFAIGTFKNVTFYDWRDIDGFYENQTCYGFKSFNDLIHVIPKRIFSDNAESVAFFQQAVALRRQHQRKFETGTTAIESGNPYQSPVN